MKKKIGVVLAALFLVVIGGSAAYIWLALSWSYSSGDRAGYINKFSHKGWLCKTWEGELAMTPVPGAVPEKFFFSVRNEAIANEINRSLGKKVSLTYEQHKGLPGGCFGETEYFVTNLKVLE